MTRNYNRTVAQPDEFEIRKEMRGNLFYFYGKIFKALHGILTEAKDFEWLIEMHTVGTWDPEFSKTTTIYFNKTLSFNAQLILQELMDDFWAGCLCFQNGFTKQAQSILRSILELLVQLYYLKSSHEQNALAVVHP